MQIETIRRVEVVTRAIGRLCFMSGRNYKEFVDRFDTHLSSYGGDSIDLMRLCHYCHTTGCPMPWENGHRDAEEGYKASRVTDESVGKILGRSKREAARREGERAAQLQNAILEQAAIRVGVRLSRSCLMHRLEEIETYMKIR